MMTVKGILYLRIPRVSCEKAGLGASGRGDSTHHVSSLELTPSNIPRQRSGEVSDPQKKGPGFHPVMGVALKHPDFYGIFHEVNHPALEVPPSINGNPQYHGL